MLGWYLGMGVWMNFGHMNSFREDPCTLTSRNPTQRSCCKPKRWSGLLQEEEHIMCLPWDSPLAVSSYQDTQWPLLPRIKHASSVVVVDEDVPPGHYKGNEKARRSGIWLSFVLMLRCCVIILDFWLVLHKTINCLILICTMMIFWSGSGRVSSSFWFFATTSFNDFCAYIIKLSDHYFGRGPSKLSIDWRKTFGDWRWEDWCWRSSEGFGRLTNRKALPTNIINVTTHFDNDDFCLVLGVFLLLSDDLQQHHLMIYPCTYRPTSKIT